MSTAMAAKRFGLFSNMVDIIPEGTRATARVEHFAINAREARLFNIQARAGEVVSPGRYAKLVVDGKLTMSDTDHELLTNSGAVARAHGDVLIGGLGLGMVALPILRKPDVRSVTIVEKNADVIDLVESSLRRALKPDQSAGLVVFNADVETWTPFVMNVHRFDFIYLDIWAEIHPNNYKQHVRLRRRYQRWLKKGGTVRSWAFADIQARLRE